MVEYRSMFNSKLRGLRFLEKIGLLVTVGSASFLVWALIYNNSFRVEIIAIVVATLVSGLVLYLFTANSLSKRISILMAQSDFSNNSQFLALAERSPLPYLTIDGKGRIISINQAGVQLFHSNIESLLQSNFLDRLVTSEKSDISMIVSKVKAGIKLSDVELALRADNQEDIWVLFSSYTNTQNGQTMISLVNVTQAKKVDEAKSEFVALATHQLRTPIAAIRWNTELLEKRIPESLNETTGHYFAKINRNIDRMTSLINDFLNVSKLELGTFATEPKVVNLKEFVNNAVDEFNEKFEQKLIKLERRELPAEFNFTTDERLLQIIISNLLSNAVKYVKDSGTIWFTTEINDSKLNIQVADNGIGIPTNEISSLFTKFYRATNAKSLQTQGTGLGLYVVKQAAEQLGGSISVASDLDKGATFIVSLPLRGVSGLPI